MKTTNLILALFMTVLLMSCAKESSKELKTIHVPKAVKTALKAKYPNAKEVEWERKDEYYGAEFENKNQEMEVVFEKDGAIVLTEHEITSNDLPTAIKTYLNENHADVAIEEAAKIVKADQSVLYEVVLEDKSGERELIFDERVNLLEGTIHQLETNNEDR